MAAEYGTCYKCKNPIYRSKATGRTWQHVDIRRASHTPVPESEMLDIEKEMLDKSAGTLH